jgi:hypothetical protein
MKSGPGCGRCSAPRGVRGTVVPRGCLGDCGSARPETLVWFRGLRPDQGRTQLRGSRAELGPGVAGMPSGEGGSGRVSPGRVAVTGEGGTPGSVQDPPQITAPAPIGEGIPPSGRNRSASGHTLPMPPLAPISRHPIEGLTLELGGCPLRISAGNPQHEGATPKWRPTRSRHPRPRHRVHAGNATTRVSRDNNSHAYDQTNHSRPTGASDTPITQDSRLQDNETCPRGALTRATGQGRGGRAGGRCASTSPSCWLGRVRPVRRPPPSGPR